ncbi:MAG: ribonuclease HI [Thermoguttaceae bacterium]|nr:ribonuclease HI [Thermoguttaceae bacterium]
MTDEIETILFTDGACSGNPGPGGWAFILRHVPSGKRMEASGGEAETTNNRMELRAVVEGLSALKRPTSIKIVSDSSYVLNGLSKWMKSWKANGWRRREKGRLAEVKNLDLWQKLDELISLHDVDFEWIKGHAGHPENERCDELAVAEWRKFKR